MGCDIHGWVEAKVSGKWVAVKELEDTTRNYTRFGLLASVRGPAGLEPKGIPYDVSDTTKFWIDHFGIDGHSHSHIELQEAAKIFLKSEEEVMPDYRHEYPEEHFFGIDMECMKQITDFRLVFWFDN